MILDLSLTDETNRRTWLFNLLNIVLGIVSAVMTVLNFFTGESVLKYLTLAYSVLFFLNYVVMRTGIIGRGIMYVIFAIEALALLTFFVVTGIPEGVSVLWVMLVPACTVAIFGKKGGSVFSVSALAVIIFLFWTPLGKALLQYEYSEVFMLRFPYVYVCMFLISFYIEWISHGAFKKLAEAEERSRYLYRHDALTGIYSRHALKDELEARVLNGCCSRVSAVVFDIDDFKSINDEFGHNAGDEVLCRIAKTILENTCEHCISCRWGGEEFLVIMNCKHDPVEIGEKIRKCVETAEFVFDEGKVSITLSVGVACGTVSTSAEISCLINKADHAMYSSKNTGKNKTTVFDS